MRGESRQMETSAVEARKRGILAEEFRERGFSYSLGNKIIWKHETFNIGRKAQQRFRDLKTGRFIKNPR